METTTSTNPTCRKCGHPIEATSYRFGSTATGWEHMVGECVTTFFHGTNADLPDGTVLVPGREIGKDNWDNEEYGTWFVWMLDSADYAACYGKFVYEVEPLGPVVNFSFEAGHTDEMESEREWEWTTTSARIVRRVA